MEILSYGATGSQGGPVARKLDLLRKSCFKTKLEIVEAGDEVKA